MSCQHTTTDPKMYTTLLQHLLATAQCMEMSYTMNGSTHGTGALPSIAVVPSPCLFWFHCTLSFSQHALKASLIELTSFAGWTTTITTIIIYLSSPAFLSLTHHSHSLNFSSFNNRGSATIHNGGLHANTACLETANPSDWHLPFKAFSDLHKFSQVSAHSFY